LILKNKNNNFQHFLSSFFKTAVGIHITGALPPPSGVLISQLTLYPQNKTNKYKTKQKLNI